MKDLLQKLLPTPTVPPLAGGLALPRNKRGLPVNGLIQTLSIPAHLYVPLTNYRREFQLPHVRIGQCVQRGDRLADGIIAPANGIVLAIESRHIVHPSGLPAPCVVIQTATETDSENTIYGPLQHLTLERIELCGIQGLGGAGFSTAKKLRTSDTTELSVDTLVINAVECEPVISCDESLMMTEAADIVAAIHTLIDMSACNRCILAIEEDKHDALLSLKNALGNNTSTTTIELQTLAPVYPSGAERPLIERVTGVKIPSGVPCSTLGIVCINVATALATWHAKQGHPMTSRVVTVAGDGINQPSNVRVTFGTTIAEVLKQTGNTPDNSNARVRAGGPLSGFDLHTLDVPVMATTNCITVERVRPQIPAQPCIRCNACSDVCPVQLLPQQLYWFAGNEDQAGTARYQLSDCIECGCCDAVCPSGIALTQTFRHAKGVQLEEQLKLKNAVEAESRFRRREQREAERAAAHEQKRAAAREKLTQRSDPIADTLSRVRRRRKAPVIDESKPSTATGSSGSQISLDHDTQNRADSDKDQSS